ncbi:MAG: PEP-CTERM sorting domain-containing protein [Desulfobacteraceae bacterium]
MKKCMIAVFALAILLGGVTSASAIPYLIHDGNALNSFQDDSAEWQAYDADGDGLLDVGDTLEGVFRVNNINGYLLQEALGHPEVAGVFSTTVLSKTYAGQTYLPGGTELVDIYNYTFGPTAGRFDEAGVMVEIYEDYTWENSLLLDWSVPSTADGLWDLITDGDKLYSLGMDGTDPDVYWLGLGAPEDLSPLQQVGWLSSVGQYNVALDMIWNAWNLEFIPIEAEFALLDGTFDDLLADFVGSGGIQGSEYNNDPINEDVIQATDDIQFGYKATPEPTTLVLVGFGLLGLGSLIRRKR